MRIVNIEGENLQIRSCWSFNENFRKNVTYDNLKVTKKQGFTISIENTFLENPEWMRDQFTEVEVG